MFCFCVPGRSASSEVRGAGGEASQTRPLASATPRFFHGHMKCVVRRVAGALGTSPRPPSYRHSCRPAFSVLPFHSARASLKLSAQDRHVHDPVSCHSSDTLSYSGTHTDREKGGARSKGAAHQSATYQNRVFGSMVCLWDVFLLSQAPRCTQSQRASRLEAQMA